MEFNFIIPIIMLITLSIYSFRGFKANEVSKYFNLATIWSAVALLSFCFAIMMFVMFDITSGIAFVALFAASFSISMKFRNAIKST